MSYHGPAALLADDGTEVPVTAHLEVFAEAWDEFTDDCGFVHSSPVQGWRGTLEPAAPSGGPFRFPLRLRLPNGREGTVAAVESGSSSETPHRLMIEGAGEPPFTTGNVLDQLRELARRLPPQPVPARLEVGALAQERLMQRAEPLPPTRPSATVLGLPIVLREDLTPGAWRLLDSAGGVLGEGNLDSTGMVTP